jgi:ribonuclease R
MLPETLSNGICSLNPEVDRLCMACDMRVGSEGDVTRAKFYPAVMRSHARLTYDAVWQVIGVRDAEARRSMGKLLPHIDHLHALYKAFDAARKRPDSSLIESVLLRSQSLAVYQPADPGHFGLALETYTHFTSPIRRYPDLIVHRTLRESRQGRMTEDRREELIEDLPEMARHTSEMERRADDAERELVQWKKVRFMADKVGDEFDGYITGVSAYGLYIELIEHFVEGMVHVSTMADDYYRFVEKAHILHGENTGKAYRLGDRVSVQVIKVDMERRQVDLGLTEILDAVRVSESNRGPRRSKVEPRRDPATARAAQRPAGKAHARTSRREAGKRKQRPGRKERAARRRR